MLEFLKSKPATLFSTFNVYKLTFEHFVFSDLPHLDTLQCVCVCVCVCVGGWVLQYATVCYSVSRNVKNGADIFHIEKKLLHGDMTTNSQNTVYTSMCKMSAPQSGLPPRSGKCHHFSHCVTHCLRSTETWRQILKTQYIPSSTTAKLTFWEIWPDPATPGCSPLHGDVTLCLRKGVWMWPKFSTVSFVVIVYSWWSSQLTFEKKLSCTGTCRCVCVKAIMTPWRCIGAKASSSDCLSNMGWLWLVGSIKL